jgi:hypothetical protein
MSVTGLCQICETARADHKCTACGLLVCDTHFDGEHGVCTDCASGDRPGELQF